MYVPVFRERHTRESYPLHKPGAMKAKIVLYRAQCERTHDSIGSSSTEMAFHSIAKKNVAELHQGLAAIC